MRIRPFLTMREKHLSRRNERNSLVIFAGVADTVCPALLELKINDCARMSLMMRRPPRKFFINRTWYDEMKKIEDCLHCGQCEQRCPYRLDIPALVGKEL